MADLAKIVDELSTLTVLEAAELSKMLEEKWGVSAAAPVAVAAVGAGGGGEAAAAEEKTEFDVILTSAGAQKINVIKEVRAITGLRHTAPGPLVEEAANMLFHRTPGSPSGAPLVREWREIGALADAIVALAAQWRPDVLHAHSPRELSHLQRLIVLVGQRFDDRFEIFFRHGAL